MSLSLPHDLLDAGVGPATRLIDMTAEQLLRLVQYASRGRSEVSPPLLLRKAAAAARLGCGQSRLYELTRDGHLETVDKGRARRWVTRSLDEYVERHKAAQR